MRFLGTEWSLDFGLGYNISYNLLHSLSLSLSLSLTHTHTRAHTYIFTYLGCKVFQNGRAVDRRSSAYPTMTRGSVFQMPVNSAYGEL